MRHRGETRRQSSGDINHHLPRGGMTVEEGIPGTASLRDSAWESGPRDVRIPWTICMAAGTTNFEDFLKLVDPVKLVTRTLLRQQAGYRDSLDIDEK